MAFTSPPLPVQDSIVDKQGRPTQVFIDIWTSTTQDVDSAPARIGQAKSETEKTAAIGTTALTTGTLAEGLYRLSASLRVTQAATTSGSVRVDFTFTRNGQTFTITGTSLGNTLGAARGESALIHIDNAIPISYSTAYASVGATPLKYDLDVVLEQVQA